MRRLLRLLRDRWLEIALFSVVLSATINLATSGNFVPAAVVLLVGLPLLALVISLLETVERRRFRSLADKSTAFRQRRRGIVFTVGLQPTTILFALHRQKPDYVGFLCSQQSVPVAQTIIADEGLDSEHAKLAVADPFNIVEVRHETDVLLRWLSTRLASVGGSQDEIVVDVTGGLTPLSLGAFSMAEERRVDIQYIKPRMQNNAPVGIEDALIVSRHLPDRPAEPQTP